LNNQDGYSDHFFTTPDGPRLHYRDYAPVGEVRGVPVVCLHGLTRNVKDFEDLAPQIAAMGRRVIVISMRGRGRSDSDPQTDRYQPLIYAIDVVSLLEEIGLDKAVFIGTSMGGIISLIIASQNSALFSAFVLNDIGPEIAQSGLDRIMSNVSNRDPAKDWNEASERTRTDNVETFPNRLDDTAYWMDLARKTWVENETGQLVYDYDPAIFDQMGGDEPLPDLWPFFEALKPIPTLVVRGGITDLLSPDTLAEMKRRKPDLETVEVPDVGHAPMLTEPEAWSAIQGFLQSVD